MDPKKENEEVNPNLTSDLNRLIEKIKENTQAIPQEPAMPTGGFSIPQATESPTPTINQPRSGGISREISRPLGGIGLRLANQAAQRVGVALFGATASIWVPIAIAIITTFIFTFIIVGFMGAPSLESDIDNAPIPQASVLPTETVTPTPAAP